MADTKFNYMYTVLLIPFTEFNVMMDFQAIPPTRHVFEEFGSETSLPILFLPRAKKKKNASLSPVVWGEGSGKEGRTRCKKEV